MRVNITHKLAAEPVRHSIRVMTAEQGSNKKVAVKVQAPSLLQGAQLQADYEHIVVLSRVRSAPAAGCRRLEHIRPTQHSRNRAAAADDDSHIYH
jgi:hypothetical protein